MADGLSPRFSSASLSLSLSERERAEIGRSEKLSAATGQPRRLGQFVRRPTRSAFKAFRDSLPALYSTLQQPPRFTRPDSTPDSLFFRDLSEKEIGKIASGIASILVEIPRESRRIFGDKRNKGEIPSNDEGGGLATFLFPRGRVIDR